MFKSFKIGSINIIAIKTEKGVKDFSNSCYNDLKTVYAPNKKNMGECIIRYSEIYFAEVKKQSSGPRFPVFILSEPLENDAEAYKNLMKTVLSSDDSNIRIFHLMQANNKDYTPVFKVIKEIILEKKYEESMALFFDLDEKIFDSFCAHFEEYPYRNALQARFKFLMFGFWNKIETQKFDNYLKEFIEILYSDLSHEEATDSILALMNSYLGEGRDGVREVISKNIASEFHYYKNFNVARDKKDYKTFVYDVIVLYKKLNAVFNRMDTLGIAYFVENEYDIYVNEVMNDMKRFSDYDLSYSYLAKNEDIRYDLDKWSHWTELRTPSEEEEEEEEAAPAENEEVSPENEFDEDDESYLIYNYDETKRKRVRMKTKIKWGSKEITKAVRKFLKKHHRFIKVV